jgi:hypothetical protein
LIFFTFFTTLKSIKIELDVEFSDIYAQMSLVKKNISFLLPPHRSNLLRVLLAASGRRGATSSPPSHAARLRDRLPR